MKKISLLVITGLIFVLLGSCLSRTETLKPKISGKAGEVLLVIPDRYWDSEIGTSLNEILASDKKGLPQPESTFDLIKVTPDRFTKVFNSHRNIVIVKIDPAVEKNKINVKRDMWATPQLFISINARSKDDCVRMLLNNADFLVDRLNHAERERIQLNYRKFIESEIVYSLQENHQLSLIIPKGYSKDVDSANFVWLANETPSTSQGILIYDYPYRHENTFTPEYLINKRNQFLKEYVPGPNPGTWMTTEDLLLPDFREFEIEGRYFSELRGLWKLENGFMGGPFISLSTVDEPNKRVVTVEGFVYAPSEKKRELLRQVESILYTLEFKKTDN